jgi:hypothetical protein
VVPGLRCEPGGGRRGVRLLLIGDDADGRTGADSPVRSFEPLRSRRTRRRPDWCDPSPASPATPGRRSQGGRINARRCCRVRRWNPVLEAGRRIAHRSDRRPSPEPDQAARRIDPGRRRPAGLDGTGREGPPRFAGTGSGAGGGGTSENRRGPANPASRSDKPPAACQDRSQSQSSASP